MVKPSLRQDIRAAISNAYYDSRDAGLTMEQAADEAAHRVVQALMDWVGDNAVRAEHLAYGATAVDAEFLWGSVVAPLPESAA